jgi:hypothetical protein
VILVPVVDFGPERVIQQEYQKLELIKAQIYQLRKELHHQEGKIFHILKQDFKTCDTIKCLLQTTLRKIPDFTHLVKSHFQYRPKPGPGQNDQLRFNCSRSPTQIEVDDDENSRNALVATVNDPSPLPFEGELPHPPFNGPPPPFGKDHPHPPFDGPPPFGKGHHHPPLDGPPPRFPHGEHSLPDHQGQQPHTFHHHHRRHHVRIIKGVVALVVIAFALSFLFRQIRQRITLFHNARRSADRAARREERHNRRAYRSAARRHQWARWWNRYRRPCSTTDYEEKRALIIDQENILEDAMQGEINNLRTAHEIVGEMIRAEEGRARLYYQANLPPSRRPASAAELDAGIGSSTRPTSLPAYIPPPRYEEELEGDITVVDGFQYTPSATDETPDSSVVDCSPRLSFETGRTTLMKEPRD